MQSRMLPCMLSADLTVLRCMHAVFYIQYQAVLFASNERSCIGRDVCCVVCCIVSCHPSRLMQCTRSFSVLPISTEIPQTLKELMDTSVVTDSQAFFTHWSHAEKLVRSPHIASCSCVLCGTYSRAGLILSSACTCSAGSIRGQEEIEKIR